MQSPILEYLAHYGVDPAYIMIGLLTVMGIMIILYIRVIVKMKKLYKKYDRFMRGKDMESMEDMVTGQLDRLERLEESDKEKKEQIEGILKNLRSVYQKSGLVKYDAFREMSGKLSYALALLDMDDNGIMISSMYSREGCYSYVKKIVRGKSSINLSEEEEQALKIAVEGGDFAE